MFEGTILVPVDFGEASARAVQLAGFVTQRYRSPALRLLHAETEDAPAYFTMEQLTALERQQQARRAQVSDYLQRFGRQHTLAPFVTAVDNRAPVDAILHEAEAALLVVMGTHGRHGPKRWWLGSVAERVLRATRAPLVITRAGADMPAAAAFQRIVVHAAAPLRGEQAWRYAVELAAQFGGAVEDARYGPIEPTLAAANATMLVAAKPAAQSEAWLSNFGEPLVRSSTIPILFVPEIAEGVTT
jgi:nucleotide-binding universal stress UspA family protein